jgi:eukaryotic-like serine/threonine-protein kinase
MTGQTISHYRILEKLGEGGMGVVYKAEDTKLRRVVALKFLPAHALENRERFLREAQAAASLNHPNLCTIHEIDEEHGFIAMEFIDGLSVNERIAERPLPLDEALDICVQACAGLQAAHERGIVHRDIKPANLMLTKQGQVKVMDFGLAQVSDRTRLTKSGISVGTPAYMSPEQAQGQSADRRTDTWSIGVVLYEMVTGKVPFRGENEAAVARAILDVTAEPPTALRSGLPLSIDRLLAKAMAKDPNMRYQRIDDLLVDLKSISGGLAIAPSRRALSKREKTAWTITGMCATAAIAMASLSMRPVPAPDMISFAIFPQEEGLSLGNPQLLKVSPSGSAVAFVARDSSGLSQVWLRPLSSHKSRPVNGTQGASAPFWSPDGSYIGFLRDSQFQKIAVSGGAATTICDIKNPGLASASWNQNGDIVFQPSNRTALFKVNAAGGVPEQLTSLDSARNENSHRFPIFLPDGKRFLFTARASTENTQMMIGSLGSRSVRPALKAQSNFVFALSEKGQGHLLFVRDGALLSQPADSDTMQPIGDPVILAEGIQYTLTSSYGAFDVSSNGRTLAYVAGQPMLVQLTWFDRNGTLHGTLGPKGSIRDVRISPDHSRAVFSMPDPKGGNREIWLIDFQNQSPQRLTLDSNNDWQPVWSPDGSQILFQSDRQGGTGKVFITTPGGTQASPAFEQDANTDARDWTTSGVFIYAIYDGDNRGIWTRPAKGSGKPVLLFENEFGQTDVRASPDSRWIAYASSKSGRFEVYLRPLDGNGAERQVSAGGGTSPRWSRDGKELYYLAQDFNLMSVEFVRPGEPGAARKLFPTCLRTPGSQNYDVNGDGQRFLFECPAVDETNVRIHVIHNWQRMLERQLSQ